MGLLPAMEFTIFGTPVAQSRSPALHNAAFALTGLPHHYGRHDTPTVDSTVRSIIHAQSFGGGSVTIPLKQEMVKEMDDISADVKIIGAMNTIVPTPRPHDKPGQGPWLVGHNTDWQGIAGSLRAVADKIHPLPYPGLNADNLPYFVPIASVAKGRTLIHDWMYENRAIYYTEMTKIGADNSDSESC